MSKIALDLTKFKHHKSDAKGTHLKHDDGHVLIIAHKALSPEGQEQMKALAKVPKKEKDKHLASGGTVESGSKDMNMAGGGNVGPHILGSPQSGVGQAMETEDEDQFTPKEVTPAFDPTAHAYAPIQKEAPLGRPTSFTGPAEAMPSDVIGASNASKNLMDIQPGELAEGGVIPKSHMKTSNKIMQSDRTQGPESRPGENVFGKKQEVAPTQGGEDYKKKMAARPKYAEGDKVKQPDFMSGLQSGPQTAGPSGVAAVPQEPDVKTPEMRNAAELAKLPPLTSEMNQAAEEPDSVAKAMPAPESAPLATAPKADGIPDYEQMLKQGYQGTIKGMQGEATAKGALGADQAALLNQKVQDEQKAQSTFQNSYKTLEAERQAHMHDIQEGYIDPNKYWTGDKNGNGSHSRIASGIGMILAGFNPTSQPNAAINFLNHQMEQNLTAQRENLGAKQNLLSANLRQFGNLRDATDMTRIMQNDVITNQLQGAIAKAATPMAQAEMQKAIGQFQQQSSQTFMQLSMRHAMMNLANDPGGQSPGSIDKMLGFMRVTNPEMAKEMESRYIPGVGLGSVPVPEAVRSQIVSHQKLNDSANDLLNFTKTHTTLNPMSADFRVGAQKALILQQQIREGMLGTVFRESEKPLLNKMVDENPAGLMKAISTDPKLRQIIDSNTQQLNALKSNYGIHPSHNQVQQAAHPREGQTGTLPTGQRIKIVNGQQVPIR